MTGTERQQKLLLHPSRKNIKHKNAMISCVLMSKVIVLGRRICDCDF